MAEEELETTASSELDDYLVKNRIETYEECKTEYERAVDSHINASKVWAKIDKLFNGLPPFNQAKLKKLNQGHVTNADFGDARTRLQRALVSYQNIFFKSQYLAEINVEPCPKLAERLAEKGVAFDAVAQTQWSTIITEEWTKNKRTDWGKKFHTFIDAHLREVMLYGVNHIFFPHKESPIPEAGTRYAHYTPRDAWVDVDKNDVHIIKHEFSVFELIEFWKNDETGYWNKDALEQVLRAVMQDEDGGEEQNLGYGVGWIEEALARMKRHDGCNSEEFYNKTIEVASLYVREFCLEDGTEGGVSHIIFTPHEHVEAPIFFHDRAYERMGDVVIISTLLPGYSKIREAKGLGHINYAALHEKRKMQCTLATNFKVNSTQFFSTDTGSLGDLRKVQIPIGGVSVVPDNVKIQSGGTNGNLNNMIAAIQYFDQLTDKNDLIVLNTASDDRSPVGHLQQRAKEFVETQQNLIAHDLITTLDCLYETILRKELKYHEKGNYGAKLADEFIERCIKRGVPKELFEMKDIDEITGLPEWMRINAYKGTGTGSAVGDMLKIQEAYQLGIPQKLGPRGREYFQQLEAAAVLGQDAVGRLYPEADTAGAPTMALTFADVVANQLARGEFVRPSEDLDHFVFATVLLERMQQIANEYQQAPKTGAEEVKQQERELLFKTDRALQAIGTFLAYNITFLANDPTKREFFRSILPQFQQLEGFAKGIRANAERAAQAEAREQAEMQAGNNIAMQKLVMEHQLKIREQDLKNVREFNKSRASFQLKATQARMQERIAMIKARGDVQAKLIKANSDVQIQERRQQALPAR